MFSYDLSLYVYANYTPFQPTFLQLSHFFAISPDVTIMDHRLTAKKQ